MEKLLCVNLFFFIYCILMNRICNAFLVRFPYNFALRMPSSTKMNTGRDLALSILQSSITHIPTPPPPLALQ